MSTIKGALPNSKWLQKELKCEAEVMEEVIDNHSETDDDIEEYIQCKTDLKILIPIIKLATKSGKYVILTKAQWDGLHNFLKKILKDISEMGEIFGFDHDVDPCRNKHSLRKYLDLFESGISSSDYEQWKKCVEGLCYCSSEQLERYR
jgi:hypothetical protein